MGVIKHLQVKYIHLLWVNFLKIKKNAFYFLSFPRNWIIMGLNSLLFHCCLVEKKVTGVIRICPCVATTISLSETVLERVSRFRIEGLTDSHFHIALISCTKSLGNSSQLYESEREAVFISNFSTTILKILCHLSMSLFVLGKSKELLAWGR